ncbi:MAG TPA: hypothetical protein VJ751_08190, partial [Pyrinomonadaceae bacterium]|nr:hypothetical protein [Pyrinomonadaceae bacterium]
STSFRKVIWDLATNSRSSRFSKQPNFLKLICAKVGLLNPASETDLSFLDRNCCKNRPQNLEIVSNR